MAIFRKKRKKKASKKSQAFGQNTEMLSRITKEFRVASSRYADSIKRSNIFKSSAIYGNPWFLMMGPENCGKKSLFTGGQVDFPLKYPEDRDGDTVSGMKWFFGNKAVYLEMPGRHLEDDSSDMFKAVYQSLSECRSERPVDGIICVVSVDEFLAGDNEYVKALAGRLRRKLDELIAFWGMELPVFCVFSKADEIGGFYQFFNDASVNWSEHVLGATFNQTQQSQPAAKVLKQEFDLLNDSLKALRLKRLSKEKKEDNRRNICRFVIQFEGLESKITSFVAELFKESAFEGKPVFRGFYFVSCKTIEISGGDSDNESLPQVSDLSKTIVNHPLNPNRMAAPKENNTKSSNRKQVKSFFLTRLFEEIFSSGTQQIRRTQRFSRKQTIRYWSVAAIITLVCSLSFWYLLSSYQRVAELHQQTREEISAAMKTPENRIEAYEQLGRISELLSQYRRYSGRRAAISKGFGFLSGREIYEALKEVYLKLSYDYLVVPSVSYFEHNIRNRNMGIGELSGDEYNELYRLLKAYLSVSQMISGSPGKIDTVLVREKIEEAIHQTIKISENRERLPGHLENIISVNAGIYCQYLLAGEMPLYQQDNMLVRNAQHRLSRLPDAKTLFESMRNRLLTQVPVLSIGDLSGAGGDGILTSSRNVSRIYTQEGWDRFVADEIETIIQDPFRVDWVLGLRNQQTENVAFDKNRMRTEIIELYLQDVTDKWLGFLSSVNIETTSDVTRMGRMLQRLSADNSELAVLLNNVISLSTIDVTREADGALGAVKAIAKNKADDITANHSRLGRFGAGDRAAQQTNALDPLVSFVNSRGRLGGLNGYSQELSRLAEALLECSKQSSSVLNNFDGKSNDPLLSAWTLTQNITGSMPERIAASVRPVLTKPIEMSGAAVERLIIRELNQKWQNDIAGFFTNNLSGKYPFSRSENEVPFDEVMNFFRPNTGLFWSFVSQNLGPYLKKENNAWSSQPVGVVNLTFNDEFFSAMRSAEVVTSTFFNRDGTLRNQTLTIQPLPQNRFQGSMFVGDHKYNLDRGNRIRLQWPFRDPAQDVKLEIHVNDNFNTEIQYSGPWGIFRLFEASRVNVMNNTTFVATWERNIQNVMMVQYGCQVQVAGTSHPFARSVFTSFNCPVEIF
ncbi:type VI secretion system protein ImpL [Chitinispirillum alkaliphilum]|nr:type VI secretion system protein ImpL [Chitinispirillum alkaliphilum]